MNFGKVGSTHFQIVDWRILSATARSLRSSVDEVAPVSFGSVFSISFCNKIEKFSVHSIFSLQHHRISRSLSSPTFDFDTTFLLVSQTNLVHLLHRFDLPPTDTFDNEIYVPDNRVEHV